MVIFEEGRTKYSILLPQKAGECLAYAAKELQKFIKAVSGVQIPICREGHTPAPEKVISLGQTKRAEQAKIAPCAEGRKKDTFRILGSGEDIFIIGNRDRGTLYGVYEFLERYLGIRFVTRDCTHIPHMARLEIEPPAILEEPAFAMRSYWTKDTQDYPAFAARMRSVTVWNFAPEKYGGSLYTDYYADGHNVLLLTEAEKNFEAHPECFAMIGGERTKLDICWTSGIKDDGTLDESQEISAAKLLIEGIKARILEQKYGPETQYFIIMQEDSRNNICTCPRCQKIYEKYGKRHSAQIIRMLNVVAREIGKWSKETQGGKEFKFITTAYMYSEFPPVTQGQDGSFVRADDQIVPDKNVYIQLASVNNDNKCYSIDDARQTKEWKSVLGGWRSLTDNLLLYEYTTNFNNYLWYHPNLRALAGNIRYMKEHFSDALITFEAGEMFDGLWQAELRTYVFQKLMWNPQLSPEPLIEEFCRLYYGKYAETVLGYIGAMEARLDRLEEEQGASFHMLCADHEKVRTLNYKNFPAEFLQDWVKKLENARESAAKDGSLTKRERKILHKRLTNVLCTPKMMLHYNYNEYFGNFAHNPPAVRAQKLKEKNDFLISFAKDMREIDCLDYLINYFSYIC